VGLRRALVVEIPASRTASAADFANRATATRLYSGGEFPKYGTVWSIYYPNVMLEWYPYSLVVSTLVPRSPDHTTNILEFYYPEEIALFERGLVEAHQAAYAESAAEDAAACVWLQKGRQALYAGRGRRGPYRSPHEHGMVHFHEFSGRAQRVSPWRGPRSENGCK
jgi:choline monooxygenase